MLSGKSLETAPSDAAANPLEGEQDEPLGFLVHEVANAISQAYGALMAPIGLTRPQMRVLIWVERRPGISQAKLSELLGISAMAMTGLLDRMEAKNLVRRQEDPTDRRAKCIYLTDGALALKPEMEDLAAGFGESIRQGLSEDDLATTQRVLTAVKANVEKVRADTHRDPAAEKD
jgi:DNA-binding MarR family transcriptional regulator